MSKDTSVLVSAFKAENPEAYSAIFNLGAESAKPDAMKAGAEVERKRLEAIVGESAFDAGPAANAGASVFVVHAGLADSPENSTLTPHGAFF